MIIGVLVLGLILWMLVFKYVAPTAWNAVAKQINTTWANLTGATGEDAILIHEYVAAGSNVDSAGKGASDITVNGGGNNGNSGNP